MTAAGWIQIALFVAVLTALTPLLGGYLARVLQGEPIVLDPPEQLRDGGGIRLTASK